MKIAAHNFDSAPPEIRRRAAFTLIEVMVVMVLLSLIVIALMAVFNSTQTAFRASITQTDVLESGRAAMDLMADDLRQVSPSLGASNGAVNFYAAVPSGYQPLVQSLVASSQQRTYVLENFFILNRDNQTWTGVGYAVNTNSTSINSLYRFSASTNVSAADPATLYNIFSNTIATNAWANMSHLMDGVVGLTVRAFDTNGFWMTNFSDTYGGQTVTNRNVRFVPPSYGESGFYMFSNSLPAAVEVEMSVLEDRTLQRVESLNGSVLAQSNYLAQQAGKVHVFRQRVSIPNVNPAAYQ